MSINVYGHAIHVSFGADTEQVEVSDIIPLEHIVSMVGPPADDEDAEWRLRLRHVARTGRHRLDRPGITVGHKVLPWMLFDLAYFLAVEDPDTCWLIELAHLTGIMQTSTPYAAKQTMRVRYDWRDLYKVAEQDSGKNAMKVFAEEGWRLRAMCAYHQAVRSEGDVITVMTGKKTGLQAIDKILGR